MGALSLESHEGSSESRGAGCGKDLSSSGPSSSLSSLIFPAPPVDKLFLCTEHLCLGISAKENIVPSHTGKNADWPCLGHKPLRGSVVNRIMYCDWPGLGHEPSPWTSDTWPVSRRVIRSLTRHREMAIMAYHTGYPGNNYDKNVGALK